MQAISKTLMFINESKVNLDVKILLGKVTCHRTRNWETFGKGFAWNKNSMFDYGPCFTCHRR